MNKKIISAALGALAAVSLAACGQSTPASNAQSSGSTGSDAAKSYEVGIIQLVQHPALDAATQGFKDALVEKLGDRVKFDTQNASGDVPTCTIIANQFVSSGVDLIMANATPALQAAQTATNTIPILGTSVTDYATALDIDNWAGVTGKNISGTADLAPLDQQAKIIQELFPDAKNIGILYCSAEPNSKFQSDVIAGYLNQMGYATSEYTFSDSNDIQAVTTVAVAESDVIYVPTDNTVASNTEVIKNITLPAGVPVVAGEAGICTGTGVATLSISYYDLGFKTGEMAAEILENGADPATLPIAYAPKYTKLYNPEIAPAFGLNFSEEYQPLDMEG